jgi:hypothetical protein
MSDEPELKLGGTNPPEWVTYAQQLLNAAHGAMNIGDLAESGTFDVETESEVSAFQGRAGLPVDGIIGVDTWPALIAAATARQAERDAASAADEGNRSVGSQDAVEDPPPTYLDVDRGRQLLDYFIPPVIERATKFAESVDALGTPNEVLPKLIDGAQTGLDLVEIIGNVEEASALGEALFVGGALGSLLVPFTMWYEAIYANNAGDMATHKWQVYRPFMAGFLPGLYGEGAREVDPLFVAVRDQAYSDSSGLAAVDKKGLLAVLLSMSDALDYIPDESNPTMSASLWALSGSSHGYTNQGLENEIHHRDP